MGQSQFPAHATAALTEAGLPSLPLHRPVASLSGGERTRLALARLPPFLLLGEPTNHLDLTSIEELENALKGFDGALIVISHDETFLQTIGIEREIAL
jgi:ATPase subunit of ABC transporter with duplicated ATPase domains